MSEKLLHEVNCPMCKYKLFVPYPPEVQAVIDAAKELVKMSSWNREKLYLAIRALEEMEEK